VRLQPLGHLSVFLGTTERNSLEILYTCLRESAWPHACSSPPMFYFAGVLGAAFAGRNRIEFPGFLVSLVLAFLGFVQLLGQVVLVGHLFNRVQLAFQPVDVVFFIVQDLLHQFARTVVPYRYGDLDAVV
jgi:hypothetical protein